MSGNDKHTDWCEEHDDDHGCATDWVGYSDYDRGTQILTRILQRPGQAPVVQLSLQHDGKEIIADFEPYALRGLTAEIRGVISEAQALAYEHEQSTKSS